MNTNLMLVTDRSGQAVAEDSEFFYRSLSDAELEKTIRDLFKKVGRGVWHTTAEVRDKLLPALTALRQRTPHGKWAERVRALGLSPDRVRQWTCRERQARREVRQLLGEPANRRRPGKREARSESELEQLVAAATRLATAVLKEDFKYAQQLAVDFLEAWES